MHQVDPETVGQYTGLTANGKKIFEGDILKFDYIGRNRGVNGIASVVFENGKFGVLWGGLTMAERFKVIRTDFGSLERNLNLLEEDERYSEYRLYQILSEHCYGGALAVIILERYEV
jgi:hypothetical protein